MVVEYQRSSPYFDTPQRNFLLPFLDLLKLRQIPPDPTDQIVVVRAKFNQRPDLLSNDLYGTPNLWWVFAVRNKNEIVDPIFDVVTDLELFAPTQERLFRILGL